MIFIFKKKPFVRLFYKRKIGDYLSPKPQNITEIVEDPSVSKCILAKRKQVSGF